MYMENRSYFKISKYDELEYYDRLLNQYLNNLYGVGLDREDYKDISKIVRELDKIRSSAYWNWFDYVRHNKYLLDKDYVVFGKDLKEEYIKIRDSRKEYLDEVESVRGHFEKILELIRKSIKPDNIEDYLQEECSITHLVFTNNTYPKIKLYSNDGFMFLCHFHNERTPSMGVVNSRNYGMCYGCGHSFRCVDYIEKVEGLSHRGTVSLLARVYMVDIKDSVIGEDSELVQRYRSSLLSDEFRELLERGYERTSKREDSVTKSLALAKFERDFATIDRIRRGECVEFDEEKDKEKKLLLQI